MYKKLFVAGLSLLLIVISFSLYQFFTPISFGDFSLKLSSVLEEPAIPANRTIEINSLGKVTFFLKSYLEGTEKVFETSFQLSNRDMTELVDLIQVGRFFDFDDTALMERQLIYDMIFVNYNGRFNYRWLDSDEIGMTNLKKKISYLQSLPQWQEQDRKVQSAYDELYNAYEAKRLVNNSIVIEPKEETDCQFPFSSKPSSERIYERALFLANKNLLPLTEQNLAKLLFVTHTSCFAFDKDLERFAPIVIVDVVRSPKNKYIAKVIAEDPQYVASGSKVPTNLGLVVIDYNAAEKIKYSFLQLGDEGFGEVKWLDENRLQITHFVALPGGMDAGVTTRKEVITIQ